jgi:hypothetical protein
MNITPWSTEAPSPKSKRLTSSNVSDTAIIPAINSVRLVPSISKENMDFEGPLGFKGGENVEEKHVISSSESMQSNTRASFLVAACRLANPLENISDILLSLPSLTLRGSGCLSSCGIAILDDQISQLLRILPLHPSKEYRFTIKNSCVYQYSTNHS